MAGLLIDVLWFVVIALLACRWERPERGVDERRSAHVHSGLRPVVCRPSLLLLGLALLPILFVFANNCVVAVPAAHMAAVYDPLRGGIQTEVLPEGLHLVMPWWTTLAYSQQTQGYTMSGTSHGVTEEQGLSDEAIRCQTNEGMTVAIDCTVLFHIDPSRANEVWGRLGDGTDVVRLIVRPFTHNVLRMVVAKYSVVDVFAGKRKQVETEITSQMKPLFGEKGIVLEQLLIRNVAYGNPAFADAINAKQVAQQQVQTEEQKLERARIEKQTIIAEASGEANAIDKRGATLRQNPEVVQYEFVQKVAPRLNHMYLPASSLPTLQGGH